MKGEILLSALELIEKFAYTTADFIEAYCASSKSDYRALRNFRPKYHKTLAGELREALQEKQRFYNLLHRLQHDSLIEKTEQERMGIWRLTVKGREKMKNIKLALAHRFPVKKYSIERSDAVIIVSFDIPERERKKRAWLREVLAMLGFRLLHKSVWIGKVKLPNDFLEDLRRLKLVPYVEIFAVSKTGTLRHII